MDGVTYTFSRAELRRALTKAIDYYVAGNNRGLAADRVILALLAERVALLKLVKADVDG